MNNIIDNIYRWQFTREELNVMTIEDLKNLIIGKPQFLKYDKAIEDFNITERRYLDSKLEKEKRFKIYKEAMRELKQMSFNPDGTKVRLTPEMRSFRKQKELLYCLYKEELERNKFLDNQLIIKTNEMYYSTTLYNRSMEKYITLLIKEKKTKKRLSLQEKIVMVSNEESNELMDDVCIICMEQHTIGDTLLTCCGHRFGKECFGAWHKQCITVNQYVNCPMCKNQRNLSITKYQERVIIRIDC
jgi:hypothetical protein